MTKINVDPSSHNVLAETVETTSQTREVRINSEGFTATNLEINPQEYLTSIEAEQISVTVTGAERNNSGEFTDSQLEYASSRQLTYATGLPESVQKALEDHLTPENLLALSVGAATGPFVADIATTAGYSATASASVGTTTSGLVVDITRATLEYENSKIDSVVTEGSVMPSLPEPGVMSTSARPSDSSSHGDEFNSSEPDSSISVDLAPAIIRRGRRLQCTISCVENGDTISEAISGIEIVPQSTLTRTGAICSQAMPSSGVIPPAPHRSSGFLAYAVGGGLIFWGIAIYLQSVWNLNGTKKK